MQNIVLRANAVPVYGFLSAIAAQAAPGEPLSRPQKILDCGAGGPLPPLTLFYQHGFDAWGIDSSQEQIDLARQFCQAQHIPLHLQKADMRQIPFEDAAFDHVYEHYAMCHLSKRDTALAVQEMRRVLKPGGLCFLGVISQSTWPHALFGQEAQPGEYWGEEDGEERALHSLFSDAEADALVAGWTILSRSKQIRFLRKMAEETSPQAWQDLYPEAGEACSPEEWQARYADRAGAFQYAHLYFILQKPSV
jgi:ubiquinone/menaquinone biosynthesis C-methylase UbiE